MTNSDKDNIFFAPALAKCSAQKRNITQASNETNWWSFDKSLAGCLENINKL